MYFLYVNSEDIALDSYGKPFEAQDEPWGTGPCLTVKTCMLALPPPHRQSPLRTAG